MNGVRGFVATAWAVLLVIAFSLTFGLLVLDLVDGISLYIAIETLPKPPLLPLHLRDFAELVSFVATTLGPFIAIAAGVFAYRQFAAARNQFESAEKTRLVSVYLTVSEKWDSDGVAVARRQILGLEDFFVTHSTELGHFARASEYIHAVLLEFGENSRLYKNYILLMSYLEDIRLLCRNDYLSIVDVNNIIGEGVTSIVGLLLTHIEHERAEMARRDGPRLAAGYYANALYLYDMLRPMTPVGIAGYGVPAA
ncbi:MAG TPA: hypothetical protein VGR70_17385 [Stellaceae bacterium]|nr:hypothetical protein [Stellaceae bacterium]